MAKKRSWTPEEVRQWFDRQGTRIYCNGEDANWVVRKPGSRGWAMNLASGKAWLILASVLIVLLLAVGIGRWYATGTVAVIGGADGPTAIFITRP